jgi:hypothetical protein
MYYDYNKPLAVKLTEKQIEVYSNLLSLVPSIEEVLRRFDGKIVNKRISTALQAVARGVCFDKSLYSGRWELTACEWDNRSVPGEPDRFGYCGAHYIKDETLHLANDGQGEGFIDGEGRLCAKKAIAAIEKNREHYQRKIEAMREQLSHIDSIISKYKALEAAKKEFNDNLDYSIRDYFGLKLD